MSQAWMKFYPSDWRADPALRMCSIGARGLWMEMLCIMHEASPRGSLSVNSRPLNERQLASLCGASVDEVTGWLGELEDNGVFSRDDDATIFSRRIRRDDAKAAEDKANGLKGGNPHLRKGVNPLDNPPVGGGDKAHIPDTRSHKKDDADAQADASVTLAEKCLEAAGLSSDPKAVFWPIYPIANCIRDGAILELDVLPTLRRFSSEGRRFGSWAYPSQAIMDAKASREAPAPIGRATGPPQRQRNATAADFAAELEALSRSHDANNFRESSPTLPRLAYSATATGG